VRAKEGGENGERGERKEKRRRRRRERGERRGRKPQQKWWGTPGGDADLIFAPFVLFFYLAGQAGKG